MSQNVISVLRRIRACEGEAAAQVVLDHFVRAQANEAYERAAHVCEISQDMNVDPIYIAQAIRALKYEAPTNETDNARPGGE